MTTTRALGGPVAILLFAVTLAAFVIQSGLTQVSDHLQRGTTSLIARFNLGKYVQGTLGFRQPFFLLYITHSSFIVIFPIHLLYLVSTSHRPVNAYISAFKATLTRRLTSVENTQREKIPFPTSRFVGLVFALSAGINVPGLLWYVAVSLASLGDVTALWNTNSFWVYVISVRLYRLNWEPRKLGAVVLACVGVLLDVYGGSKSSKITDAANVLESRKDGPTAPIIGEALTFVASISYAFYEVLYKRYAALPTDAEGRDGHDAASVSYESLSDASTTPSLSPHRRRLAPEDDENTQLPFGLYPNLLTSLMGLCTAVFFSIGFPVLHWSSIERFIMPPDGMTLGCVVAIASAGVVYNSCFMILLGLWGPVLTSVGNLLTIVLVLITDFLFDAGSITIWNLLGSGMIVAAFGVLVLDMIRPP